MPLWITGSSPVMTVRKRDAGSDDRRLWPAKESATLVMPGLDPGIQTEAALPVAIV